MSSPEEIAAPIGSSSASGTSSSSIIFTGAQFSAAPSIPATFTPIGPQMGFISSSPDGFSTPQLGSYILMTLYPMFTSDRLTATMSLPSLTHTGSTPPMYVVVGSSPPFANLSSEIPFPSIFRSPGYNLLSHPSQTPFHGHLNQTCVVKLTRDNYLLWKSIVLPIVRGHRLEGYLLGTIPRSSPLLGTTGHQSMEEWSVMDNVLMGWLLSYMTEHALVEIIGCHTSHEVWITLESLFNSQSEARMLELKSFMTKADKGSKSMADYLALMKSYGDNLAADGYPIFKSELILVVLGGLGREYEAVIVNLTARVGSLSWQEVRSQLLIHEKLIARFNPRIRSLHP